MSLFKAEVFVLLEYDSLCWGCFFFSGGGGENECELAFTKWESDECVRPAWCPLKEVKVMKK